LVDALHEANFHVRLKHVRTETSRQKHGWIKIVDSRNAFIVQDEKFQHNENYHARRQIVPVLLKKTEQHFENLRRADVSAATARPGMVPRLLEKLKRHFNKGREDGPVVMPSPDDGMADADEGKQVCLLPERAVKRVSNAA